MSSSFKGFVQRVAITRTYVFDPIMFSVESLLHFRASKHAGTLSLTKYIVLPLRFSLSRKSACLISCKHSLFSTSISSHHATSPTQSFPQEEGKSGQLFNDDITEFLLNECGVYDSQLPTIHRRIHYKPLSGNFLDTARQVLQLFRDLGFTPHQVRAVIKRHPLLLTIKVNRLKPKIDHLTTLGLTREDLAVVITRNSRFLGSSFEKNFNPRIRSLVNLFGSEAHLSQAIRRAPGILIINSNVTSNVAKKLKLMKSIGLLEDETKDMFKRAPQILCITTETLDKRLKHVAKLGLTDEEIKQILVRFPWILRLSVDKMQKNMDFLIHTAGFEPNIIRSYPMFLIYSLEKRLKPRFMLYKYLTQSSELLPISLVTMLGLPNEEFFCRFLSDLQTFKLYESYAREPSDTALSG